MGVVVLSQYAEPRVRAQLLEAGSARRAYLLKERVHHRGQLVDAVRAVQQGGSYIDPKIVELLVQARANGADSPLAVLTPRERETLAEIAAGQEQRGDRRVARAHQARGREAHQRDLHEAQPRGAPDVCSRVKATLLFLAESGDSPPPARDL